MEYMLEMQWIDPVAGRLVEILSVLPPYVVQTASQPRTDRGARASSHCCKSRRRALWTRLPPPCGRRRPRAPGLQGRVIDTPTPGGPGNRVTAPPFGYA